MIDPVEGRQAIIEIQKALAGVRDGKFVFVGGGIIPLLITDMGAATVRPTKDMDVVFEVASVGDYSFIRQELLNVGFRDLISDDIPACALFWRNWRVDFLCATPGIVPGSNRWFPYVIADAELQQVEDVNIWRASTATFIATKLEAWFSRGRLPDESPDYLHQDMEDIVAVIDGRNELIEEIEYAPPDVLTFLRRIFADLLKTSDFLNFLPGHVGGEERARMVVERMKTISDLQSWK